MARTTASCDIAVIGAGIAGASVAAELAPHAKVLLLEMEAQPGYHTTGRSAAIFAPSYGPAPVRALTRASRGFYLSPPPGFAEIPLFSPRRIMMIARQDQLSSLEALIAELGEASPVSRIGERELRAINPLVREGYATAGMLDENGQDIDVAALHQGYLRRLRAAGGAIMTRSEVTGLSRDRDGWSVITRNGAVVAALVVNAAGAWADRLGEMAGAGQIGLVPKRRTALTVAAPDGFDASPLPLTIDIDEGFYLKPDAGRLLLSPADETPSRPCDAQPDEMDVAVCIDRIETAFDLSVRRIESKWAGLRSFVPDKSPVAGFSTRAPGFFWLAGQGGYGIQTAPALARLAASLITGQQVDADILDQGLDLADLAPERLKER